MYLQALSQHQKRNQRALRGPWRSIILLSLVIVFSSSMAGCSIGLKERIVYAGLGKFPEEAYGTLRVATNRPIPITVAGTDIAGEKNVGGYLLIHPRDLKILIEALEENRKLKERD